MTDPKPFDPTRPCQYRDGSAVCELLHLKRPIRGGFNMISVDRKVVEGAVRKALGPGYESKTP